MYWFNSKYVNIFFQYLTIYIMKNLLPHVRQWLQVFFPFFHYFLIENVKMYLNEWETRVRVREWIPWDLPSNKVFKVCLYLNLAIRVINHSYNYYLTLFWMLLIMSIIGKTCEFLNISYPLIAFHLKTFYKNGIR